MTERIELTAAGEGLPMRIDRYLSEQLPDFSRSYLQKLLKESRREIILSWRFRRNRS